MRPKGSFPFRRAWLVPEEGPRVLWRVLGQTVNKCLCGVERVGYIEQTTDLTEKELFPSFSPRLCIGSSSATPGPGVMMVNGTRGAPALRRQPRKQGSDGDRISIPAWGLERACKGQAWSRGSGKAAQSRGFYAENRSVGFCWVFTEGKVCLEEGIAWVKEGAWKLAELAGRPTGAGAEGGRGEAQWVLGGFKAKSVHVWGSLSLPWYPTSAE